MKDKIKIKYIHYKEIGEYAQNYLVDYKLEKEFPIQIEKLMDNILRINIIPFQNLYRDFDTNAFISSDLKKIYVDEYLYDNLNKQYRFTLAHELGHMVLHGGIYKQAKIECLESYRTFVKSLEEEEYHHLEFQANCFAGHFLVPAIELKNQFEKHIKKVRSFISMRSYKLQKDEYAELVTIISAREISPFFDVHPRVVQIRIEKDRLINKFI